MDLVTLIAVLVGFGSISGMMMSGNRRLERRLDEFEAHLAARLDRLETALTARIGNIDSRLTSHPSHRVPR